MADTTKKDKKLNIRKKVVEKEITNYFDDVYDYLSKEDTKKN